MRVRQKGRSLAVVGWILFVVSYILTLLLTNLHHVAWATRNIMDAACILLALISIMLLFIYYTVFKIENLHIWAFLLLVMGTIPWYINNFLMSGFLYVDQVLGRAQYAVIESIVEIVISGTLFSLYSFARNKRISRVCAICWLAVSAFNLISRHLEQGSLNVHLLTPVILYVALIIMLVARSRGATVIGIFAIALHAIYQVWQIWNLVQLKLDYQFIGAWMNVCGGSYILEIILDLSVAVAIWFREGGQLLFKRKIPYEQIEAELLELKTRFDRGEISARKYSRLKEKVLRKIDLR